MGKCLAKKLLDDGHELTILSRHPEKAPTGARLVGSEREEGLEKLAGTKFDLAIDFIAFDGRTLASSISKLDFKIYILISSTWMSRLGKNIKANQRVTLGDVTELKQLPTITQHYLLGKLEAESLACSRYQNKKDVVVLRLPIIWGVGDPTGRIEFYLRRILDGNPVILVDGGRNSPSMAWTVDVSRAIAWLINYEEFGKSPIWEGLASDQICTMDILLALAEGRGRKLLAVDIRSQKLKKLIPGYLEAEPLWMLKRQSPTGDNIFRRSRLKATVEKEWLRRISREIVVAKSLEDERLRRKEIRLIKEIK